MNNSKGNNSHGIKRAPATETKPVITIDVVSDVVCPWCYIGKRRLEKAMNAVADKFAFEVKYHPFELNPDTPLAGVDHRAHLAEKFGGDERYDAITGRTAQVAGTEGLQMNFDRQAILPNTRKAHALIFAAQNERNQPAVAEAFFKAYFTDGVDLSKDENLVDVAVNAGLDKTVATTALQSGSILESIAHQEHEMQKLGIRGVPFYIFNSEYGVSGAQTPDTFLKVFEELNASAASSGESCEIGGDC